MMQFSKEFLLSAATAGLFVTLVSACATGDDDKAPARALSLEAGGLAYARSVCAQCHAVEPGEAVSPNPAAPSFEALAARPGMSRPALNALLMTPHRSMPGFMIEPEHVDELAAYLYALGE